MVVFLCPAAIGVASPSFSRQCFLDDVLRRKLRAWAQLYIQSEPDRLLAGYYLFCIYISIYIYFFISTCLYPYMYLYLYPYISLYIYYPLLNNIFFYISTSTIYYLIIYVAISIFSCFYSLMAFISPKRKKKCTKVLRVL